MRRNIYIAEMIEGVIVRAGFTIMVFDHNEYAY